MPNENGVMTSEEINALLSESPAQQSQMSSDEINSLLSEGPIQPRADQGFGERVAEDISGRNTELTQTAVDVASGEIPLGVGAVQVAGKTAGAALDILGEGINSIGRGVATLIPDELEDAFKSAVKEAGVSFMNTDAGKASLAALNQGAESYKSFQENFPQAAKTLESVVNIGLILAPAKTKANAPPSKLNVAADNLEKKAIQQVANNRKKFTEELVRPKRTAKVKIEEVPRTSETGVGIFKKDVVAPSQREIDMAAEVSKIPGVKPGNSFQTNYTAISKRNEEMAKNLAKSLDDPNLHGMRHFSSVPASQYRKRMDDAVTDLVNTNPVIVGNASTTANRVKDKAIQLMDDNPSTPAGILKARKDLDAWVRSQKGSNIFDPASENALSISVRTVRQTMNDIIDEAVPSKAVKSELRKQNLLFNAMDNLAPKAANEANHAILRAWQNVVSILPFRGEFNQSLAAVLGVGGLGAAAMIAPYFTAGLAATIVVGGSGKLLMSPAAKKGVAALLRTTDRAINTSKNPSMIKQLRADRALMVELLDQAETTEQ